MDYITKRKLFVPAEAKEIQYEDIKYTAYTYKSGNFFALKIFGGRRTKTDVYNVYKTKDEATNKLNQYIQERREIAQDKLDYKNKKKLQDIQDFKNVKVGDIFYTSFGYDQTNVSFYKLMALKGKTGTFQQLNQEVVPGSEGFMSAQVKPGELYSDKPFTSRIVGDKATNMPYGQRGYKTTADKAHYSSWYA